MLLVRILALLALTIGFNGQAAAATSSCIMACEAPAIACSESTRGAKGVCVRGVLPGCRGVPLAQRGACVSKANKTCVETHNPAIDACDQTFNACHKACLAGAPVTRGYWCRAEADLAGEVTRKTGYCDEVQSEAGLAACLKRFEVPGEMGSTLLMECQPL